MYESALFVAEIIYLLLGLPARRESCSLNAPGIKLGPDIIEKLFYKTKLSLRSLFAEYCIERVAFSYRRDGFTRNIKVTIFLHISQRYS